MNVEKFKYVIWANDMDRALIFYEHLFNGEIIFFSRPFKLNLNLDLTTPAKTPTFFSFFENIFVFFFFFIFFIIL